MLIESIFNNCVLTVLWRDFYIHWQTLNEILGKDSLDSFAAFGLKTDTTSDPGHLFHLPSLP